MTPSARAALADRGVAPAANLLELRDIDFAYGRVQVLFGVSLPIASGEVVALLGTNGAGKSTLLRVAAGLERPSRGQVWFDGEDVTGVPAADMVSRGLVLLPGGKGVFVDMTVRENLDVGAYTLRREPAVRRDRIEAVLGMFPQLVDRLGVLAGSLSGGEQQQLALAKSLLLRPRLLCIDELSLGLAPVTVALLLEAVRAITALGTAVLLVEQSLAVASSICPRAVFMEKGQVRFEGRTSDLLDRSDIARAVFFGGAHPSASPARAG